MPPSQPNGTLSLRPIGVIHSPFRERKEVPKQPLDPEQTRGTLELFPEYESGLTDLEGFSHVVIVFHLHRSEGYSLLVKPYLDDTRRGLFATRHPCRPNPIGITVAGLEGIEGCRLRVNRLDVLDGTPLLDLKPHVPPFEGAEELRLGWLTDLLD